MYVLSSRTLFDFHYMLLSLYTQCIIMFYKSMSISAASSWRSPGEGFLQGKRCCCCLWVFVQFVFKYSGQKNRWDLGKSCSKKLRQIVQRVYSHKLNEQNFKVVRLDTHTSLCLGINFNQTWEELITHQMVARKCYRYYKLKLVSF